MHSKRTAAFVRFVSLVLAVSFSLAGNVRAQGTGEVKGRYAKQEF
jgi:hypothetical protein